MGDLERADRAPSGFLAGLIPPGRRSFAAAAAALGNLLRAHAGAAAVVREGSPGARTGIAHNMLRFAPDRPDSALDRRLVRARAGGSTTRRSSRRSPPARWTEASRARGG